jgi:hypothetical protein
VGQNMPAGTRLGTTDLDAHREGDETAIKRTKIANITKTRNLSNKIYSFKSYVLPFRNCW